ncbi:hypothetical protein V6N12_023497 [Hibiscus sabdariffa]|uniref:S-locus receptor kinase C-terminal domain-containing protein n=1 Tax=Hibiscus sabdariffa TaxID=183260 RepID=A0ABR2FXV1_9ROSI
MSPDWPMSKHIIDGIARWLFYLHQGACQKFCRKGNHIKHRVEGTFNFETAIFSRAWRLFCDGNSMELIVDQIKYTCSRFEVLRSIHVGLLCVQLSLEDRPSMSDVVLMQNSEVPLQQPRQPGFFTERDLVDADNSSVDNQKPSYFNDFEISGGGEIKSDLPGKMW